MEVTLVMFKADGSRRDFPLPKPRSVVGRISTCDLRIPLSAISRNHCEIYVERGTVRLRDLNSSNGTFHNGTRISREVALHPGDRVQIGPVLFTTVIDGVPAKVEASDTMLAAGANVVADQQSAANAGGRSAKAKRDKADGVPERPATSTTKDKGAGLDDLLAHVESDLRDMGNAAGSAQAKPPAKPKKPAAPPAKRAAPQLPVLDDDDDEPVAAEKPIDEEVVLVPIDKAKPNAADGALDDPIAALGGMGSGDSGDDLSWLTDDDEEEEAEKKQK